MSTIIVTTLTRKIIHTLYEFVWSGHQANFLESRSINIKQAQTIPNIGRPSISHVEHANTIEYIVNNSRSETFLVTKFPLQKFLFSCRLNGYRPQNVNHRAKECQKSQARTFLWTENKRRFNFLWGEGGAEV